MRANENGTRRTTTKWNKVKKNHWQAFTNLRSRISIALAVVLRKEFFNEYLSEAKITGNSFWYLHKSDRTEWEWKYEWGQIQDFLKTFGFNYTKWHCYHCGCTFIPESVENSNDASFCFETASPMRVCASNCTVMWSMSMLNMKLCKQTDTTTYGTSQPIR